MTRVLPIFFLLALLVLPVIPARAAVEVKNQYLKVVGDNESGRFFVRTTGGDPTIPNDQDQLLLSEDNPPTSFATVRIDGYDYKFGEDRGFFTMPMQVRNNAIVCTWTINNVDVTQLLEFGTGLLTGRPDSVKISYMVVNKDFRDHLIGVRLCLDILLGKNDGAPFKIPGIGEITTETFLDRNRLPDYWYAFDDLTQPVVRAQGTLKADGLVPPDRILFSSWSRLDKNPWDFTVIEGRGFVRNVGTLDSAVAIYWNEKNLQPNNRLGVSTMYGLYGTMTLTGNAFKIDLDGATNTRGEAVIIGADIRKIFPSPVEGVTATMILPDGLGFYNNDTAVRDLGSLATDSVNRQTWKVVPIDNAQGEMDYTVLVKGTVEKKEYKTSATGTLIAWPNSQLALVDENKLPAGPTVTTQRLPPPPVTNSRPAAPVLKTYQRYSFDFERIDRILAEINGDLKENNSLLARINELLKAKKKSYDKTQRDGDISTAGELKGRASGYLPRIQTSSSNVIRVQNVTNVIQ